MVTPCSASLGFNEDVFSSTNTLSGGSLTGRFIQHKLPSEALQSERTVTVRLPDSYDPQKEYPVVYLQDGQNMFDRRTGFMGKEWGVDESFAHEVNQGRAPDAFLVAVDNGGGERLPEYTHVPDPNYGGGKGQRYEDFLLNELMPAVESTYKIDSDKRVMLGSSLGGLVSLTIGLHHPTAFAAIGALSPSVWWADGQLSTATADGLSVGVKPRIWLDMGTEEGGTDDFGKRPLETGSFGQRPRGANGVQDVRDRTREMGEALLSKGWQLDDNLRYHEPLGGRHNEESWAARIGEVTAWLMKGI